MKRRRLRRLAAAVTALLVLAMLWWGNNSLSTEEYTYTSERLPDGWDGARIVVLTDLHGKQFGTDNVRLLEAVQAAKIPTAPANSTTRHKAKTPFRLLRRSNKLRSLSFTDLPLPEK